MSVGEPVFNDSDYPSIYPAHLATCLLDSKTVCFLVCSGGTDFKDGSGTDSVCQREFHTLS